MAERVDYAVIGLGALGSATAYHLAKAGHQVVGLERFALGHDRGASHDTSRILRHSYHTPAYVRLTHEAYADWAALRDGDGPEVAPQPTREQLTTFLVNIMGYDEADLADMPYEDMTDGLDMDVVMAYVS